MTYNFKNLFHATEPGRLGKGIIHHLPARMLRNIQCVLKQTHLLKSFKEILAPQISPLTAKGTFLTWQIKHKKKWLKDHSVVMRFFAAYFSSYSENILSLLKIKPRARDI